MAKTRILIADDERHLTYMLALKLGQAGAETCTASDGTEALALARSKRPDLVITDFQMPRMTGLELAQQMRTLPETADVPLLMLTGRGHRVPPSELARTNVRSVIAKPFSLRELIQAVSELVPLDLARMDGAGAVGTGGSTTRPATAAPGHGETSGSRAAGSGATDPGAAGETGVAA